MHDLNTIYEKVKNLISSYCSDTFGRDGGTRFYPNRPKMSDFELISLSNNSGACNDGVGDFTMV